MWIFVGGAPSANGAAPPLFLSTAAPPVMSQPPGLRRPIWTARNSSTFASQISGQLRCAREVRARPRAPLVGPIYQIAPRGGSAVRGFGSCRGCQSCSRLLCWSEFFTKPQTPERRLACRTSPATSKPLWQRLSSTGTSARPAARGTSAVAAASPCTFAICRQARLRPHLRRCRTPIQPARSPKPGHRPGRSGARPGTRGGP